MSRELDARIATEVMGWKPNTSSSYMWVGSDDVTHPETLFSERIQDAWKVVEKMESLGWSTSLNKIFVGRDWFVTLYHADLAPIHGPYTKTAPEAICLAALKALGKAPSP